MTVNKPNNSSLNSDRNTDPRSIFGHTKEFQISDKSKETLTALNASAVALSNGEMRARELSYRFVASLCDAAHAIIRDDEFSQDILRAQKVLLGTTKETASSETAGNPFLPLVRIADGEWTEVLKVKRLDIRETVWVPNRSNEKYAKVCRFAVDQEYSGEQMLEHFLSGHDFDAVTSSGEMKKVKATINAVIAFDQTYHVAKKRAVLADYDWKNIFEIPAVVKLPLTEKLMTAMPLTEGGLGFIPYRIVDGEMWLFADATAPKGDPVHREFKKRRSAMWHASKEALKASDEPTSLPDDFVVKL